MPEDSIPNQIFKKFEETIKANKLFEGIADSLVIATKENEGKIRLREILRE